MIPDYIWAIIGVFVLLALWNVALAMRIDDLETEVKDLKHELWRIR